MYSLPRLTLGDMTRASAQLRRLGAGARSMEEASQRVAQFLFDAFGDTESGERGSALVRVYKTHPFGGLPQVLKDFATSTVASGEPLQDSVRCLVLLGSVGLEPSWSSRHSSKRHKAIPLPSVDAVSRSPMIAQLLVQLGVDVAAVVEGGPALVVDRAETTFNVFHVPEAKGSPFIPAQDFVEDYRIRSVLGFGGALAEEIYAVILFSQVPISRETADAFRPLTLATKLALLPFADGPFFDEAAVTEQHVPRIG